MTGACLEGVFGVGWAEGLLVFRLVLVLTQEGEISILVKRC